MIDTAITRLVSYGLKMGLIKATDKEWTVNAVLDCLGVTDYTENEAELSYHTLEEILAEILDWAVKNGRIEDGVTQRDLLDTKLMGILTPKPAEVNEIFESLREECPQAATDYFYNLAMASDYIRGYRIARDVKWLASSPYGNLDITINLSKPEKDPKAIAAAKNAKPSGYPKCVLCKENVGYAGNISHPARQNLRAVPVEINGEDWYLQYSPYVYYNEHCIILNGEHVPMKIDRSTFEKLLGFVQQFPHYFVGSNADLPIVGGSILTHDHFQGGNYSFAMEKAPVEQQVCLKKYEDVQVGIVKWPMSVLRLSGTDHWRLIALADKILQKWRGYTDEAAFVFAQTNGEPHNTITPIARKRGENFELDLVLRNNICTTEHPLGVYHPHNELHHIKKENIGLIEVMGLAVLPARLKTEMAELACCLKNNTPLPKSVAAHAPWAQELRQKHPQLATQDVEAVLQQEIGQVFLQVLEHAGVFKCTPQGRAAFMRFVEAV